MAVEADPLACAVRYRAVRPTSCRASSPPASPSAPGSPTWSRTIPGAQGNIAHAAASKSAPDGHTVLFVVPSVITNPFYLKASIDPFRDLAPVIHLDTASMVLLAHPSFAPATTADVLAFVKANPGKVSCGASGALPSVGCELLRSHAGADLLMVMYKGNAPALNALMGGEISLLFDVVNIAVGHVRGGKVRAIASTAPRRGHRTAGRAAGDGGGDPGVRARDLARHDGGARDAARARAEAQPRVQRAAAAART